MITTSRPHFVNRNTQDLYSNGESDTLDSINENALRVRADSLGYDETVRSSHHSKPQSLTQGFAMSYTQKTQNNENKTFNDDAKSGGRFIKSKAHFLTKDQTHPNALIFDLNLTADALRLLLALHALPDSWNIQQNDIRERLGWNKKQMLKAIRSAKESGYMRVFQCRRERGRYDSNDFECDVIPKFKNLEENNLKFELPKTQNGSTVKNEEKTQNSQQKSDKFKFEPPQTHLRHAVNGPLSVILDSEGSENIDIKEQTEQGQEEKSCSFVCSSYPDFEKKMKILEPFNLGDAILSVILPKEFNVIESAIEAFLQYEKTTKLLNPKGCLKNAILQGWKRNIKKSDIENEKIETRQNKKEENMIQGKQLQSTYEKEFTQQCNFICSDSCILIKTKNGLFPLDYLEDDCIKILKGFIQNNF